MKAFGSRLCLHMFEPKCLRMMASARLLPTAVALGHQSERVGLPQLYSSPTSALPRPTFSSTSALPQPYLSSASAISQPYLSPTYFSPGPTSTLPEPYLSPTSALPQRRKAWSTLRSSQAAEEHPSVRTVLPLLCVCACAGLC